MREAFSNSAMDDLRQRLPSVSREECVNYVMAVMDASSAHPAITFHAGQARDFKDIAEGILRDAKNRRRPTQLGNAAMLQDSALYHARRALELAQEEIAVLRAAYREVLDQAARAQAAAGFYQQHAHLLEVALHQHTGFDVRDGMGRA